MNLENAKTTIIIPIYNCGKYLRRCIDSVLSQNYGNFDLILVDDGSTDESLDICKDYEYDNRVQVLQKENGGAASARNYGLEFVDDETQFVVFCDGDDFVDKDFLETLVLETISESSIDCTICNVIHNYSSTSIANIFNGYTKQIVEDPFKDERFLSSLSTGIINSPCNKLYSSKIISENRIRFNSIVYNEDIDFNIRYLKHCYRIKFVNKALYHYCHRPQSITSMPSESLVDDYVSLQETLYTLTPLRFHHLIDNFVSYQYFGYFLRLIKSGNDKKYNTLLKNNQVQRALKNHKSKTMIEEFQYFLIRKGFCNLYKVLFI